MTYRNFAFWLQGFFELSEIDSISSRELTIIKSHLDLVLNDSKTLTNQPIARDFCLWLDGVCSIASSTDINTTNVIRAKLRNVFVKEIDPSMKDVDGKLQALHDGIKNKPQVDVPNRYSLHGGDTLVRC